MHAKDDGPIRKHDYTTDAVPEETATPLCGAPGLVADD